MLVIQNLNEGFLLIRQINNQNLQGQKFIRQNLQEHNLSILGILAHSAY